MTSIYRSCFLTAFFFLLFSLQSFANSVEQLSSIANSAKWKLLLHVDQRGKAQIEDPKFLLSANDFSLENELRATLKILSASQQKAFCRFPARAVFLNRKLDLGLDESALQRCSELVEFSNYVPFDELSLIFASEVVSSASSMMGHIFFKAEGVNVNSNVVTHSLAYFTEISTINPFKLIYESTYAGMGGFFSVRPFDRDLSKYLQEEQRNLWEYKLTASKQELRLFQLHLWELKGLDIKYLFQSYNCATMTLELLALLEPEILSKRTSIVTPVDVVKATIDSKLVSNTQVEVSDLWLYHLIRDELSTEQMAFASELLDKSVPLGETDIEPTVRAFLDISLKQGSTDLPNKRKQELRQYIDSYEKPSFNILENKRPELTPQDSALDVRYYWGGDTAHSLSKLKVGYLAAGHFLSGDNRQYLSESQLALGYAAVAYDFSNKELTLDELTVYSVKSLVADTAAYPAFSSEIYVGYRPVWQSHTKEKSVFEVSGGLGKTYKLHKDIGVYWLAGGGGAATFSHSQLFAKFTAGLTVNALYNTKILADYRYDSGRAKKGGEQQSINLSLNWFPDTNGFFSISVSSLMLDNDRSTNIALQVVNYF